MMGTTRWHRHAVWRMGQKLVTVDFDPMGCPGGSLYNTFQHLQGWAGVSGILLPTFQWCRCSPLFPFMLWVLSLQHHSLGRQAAPRSSGAGLLGLSFSEVLGRLVFMDNILLGNWGTTLLFSWWGCDCARALADLGLIWQRGVFRVAFLISTDRFFILYSLCCTSWPLFAWHPPLRMSATAREASSGGCQQPVSGTRPVQLKHRDAFQSPCCLSTRR